VLSRTLTFWLPIWGPVLSLLYISRIHSNRKKTYFNVLRIYSYDTANNIYSLQSPLVDGMVLCSPSPTEGSPVQSQGAESAGEDENAPLQDISSGSYCQRNGNSSSSQRTSQPRHQGQGERDYEDDTEISGSSSQLTILEEGFSSISSLGDYLLSPNISFTYNSSVGYQ
jgi:hypothetical protein